MTQKTTTLTMARRVNTTQSMDCLPTWLVAEAVTVNIEVKTTIPKKMRRAVKEAKTKRTRRPSMKR